MADKLRVTLRKSPISYTAKTRGTVRAMGLRRIGQTIELPDNPATRGMARAIRFLVEVEEPTGGRTSRPAETGKAAPSRKSDDSARSPQAAEPTRSRQTEEPEAPGEVQGSADAAPEDSA